jgi:hypothetical protein
MKEDFYYQYQLNQSHKNLDNKAYIEITTNLMNSILNKQENKENILVIGAGNLSDFDLSFLLTCFNNVYLTDIDVLSINQALKDKKYYPKIKVKQVDYIGTRDTNFFNDFSELLKFTEYNEVDQFFQNKIRKLMSFQFSKSFNIKFDSIYISPIYTQLLYREVETILINLTNKGFSNEYKNRLLSELLQTMTDIIDHFNMEIDNLLNEDGTLFIGSDIFYLSEDTLSVKVKNAISKQERMERLYLNYQKKYGYGLGDYGLYSLSQYLISYHEKWLLWGKNQNNAYAVKFCVMGKI